MDEIKMKLSTKLMRGIVSKMLSKIISNKIGCRVDVQFNKLEILSTDGKIYLNTDLNAEMAIDDFVKFFKTEDWGAKPLSFIRKFYTSYNEEKGGFKYVL